MGFDAAIQSYIASALQIPWLRIAGRFAANLEVGDQLASFCILFIMAGYLAQKPRLVKTFIGALFALAAGGIAVQIFKHLIGRARPAMGLGDMTFIGPHFSPSGFDSFPSGHTTAMFALLAFFCRFYPRGTLPLYAAGLALSILARVVTAQHFMTDVIGGAVLGSVVGILLAARFRLFVEWAQERGETPLEAVPVEPSARRRGAAVGEIVIVAIFSALVLLIGSGLDFNSASLGLLTALAGYFLAREITGKDTALYAALLLSGSFLFVHVSRTLPTDTAWLFFTTLAFTYYAYSGIRNSRVLFALTYASIGLGILAKGWPALLPVPIFCLYEYLKERPSFAVFMRRTLAVHASYAGILALATFPWLKSGLFIYVSSAGDFFFDGLAAKTGLTRHAGRVIYYLPVLLTALFPWSFFAIAYFAREGKRWSHEPALSPSSLLASLWAGTVLGLFPFIAPASPHFLVLALPPLSCLAAGFIRHDLAASPAALKFSLLATILTAGGLAAAGVVFYSLRPQYESLKLAAPFAILTFFLIVAWLQRNRPPWPAFFAPLCLGALAFYLSAIVIALAS
jgi:membrane-associated phospholipid phosphatase